MSNLEKKLKTPLLHHDRMSEDWLRTRYARILNLEDDWDGEGAEAYSIETLRTAVAVATYLEDETGLNFTDHIKQGYGGSLDIHRKFEDGWVLLINIPKDSNSLFYFGNHTDRHIEIYSEDYESIEHKYKQLVEWLRGHICPNKKNK